MIMWFNYDRFAADFQFEVCRLNGSRPLVPAIHMGIDGISLPMFLLTTILTPLSILASFGIENK